LSAEPTPATIRPATQADLSAVVDLVNSAYRGDSSRTGWTTEADYIDGQRTSLADLSAELAGANQPFILVLSAEVGAPPMACVLVEMMPRPHGGLSGYIGMLTVSPTLQDQGVGRMMLAAAEAEASRRGADRARMTVVSIRDSLIAWYERRGYGRTGETAPFPYGDARFGLPRIADLSFIILEKPL